MKPPSAFLLILMHAAIWEQLLQKVLESRDYSFFCQSTVVKLGVTLLCTDLDKLLPALFKYPIVSDWAFLVAQTVKNLPAMQETQVSSLGQEDPLEKGMATHFSTLAWRITWTEEPGGSWPWSCKESDMTEWLTLTIASDWPWTLGGLDVTDVILNLQVLLRSSLGVSPGGQSS